jgi:SAM-dependent methyltransferase
MERHRLQFLVMKRVLEDKKTLRMRVLHIAPEPFFQPALETLFGHRDTADLERMDVGIRVDLCGLPFTGGTYDCVFASHVLEHIRDDIAAVREISRILKPGGLAFLPVPLVAEKTTEYPAPNPFESGHVRAPGPDYFDRFRPFFPKVDLYSSTHFPERYQTYEYEDRTVWPTERCPYRSPMEGERHLDIVPVCHAPVSCPGE